MLTVLNVGYPLAPVGPDAVGGGEQVLSRIDRALVEAGHRSLVIAPAGSVVAGTLVATPAVPSTIDTAARRAIVGEQRRVIAGVLAREDVDLVHLHGVDFADYLPAPGVPTLITLHLPIAFYAPTALVPGRPRTWFNCVSASQHATCPDDLPCLPPIDNGIDLGPLTPGGAKRSFAVALGRICPEKGFHLALDAARQVGARLLLAGAVFGYEAHRRYFETTVRPRLDRSRRFIGPVGRRAKRRLLASARCLLAPSLVAETSSLVAMEALACGTPVIAFRAGALPDIVEHGRTGFVVGTEREMAAAIDRVDAIDPAACRAAARRRFGAARMSAAYLAAYHALAAHR